MDKKEQRTIRHLTIAAALLLPFGLFLPVFEMDRLILFRDHFSVISGIVALFQDSQFLLGAIVLAGGVVIPALKIFALWRVSSTTESAAVRRAVTVMHDYGRWALLDVLLVAMFIVVGKTAQIIDVTPMPGLYFFMLTVAVLALATRKASRLVQQSRPLEDCVTSGQ